MPRGIEATLLITYYTFSSREFAITCQTVRERGLGKSLLPLVNMLKSPTIGTLVKPKFVFKNIMEH